MCEKTAMTNVHPLTGCDLIVGARTAPPKCRQREPTFTAALKAARKVGADRVEVVDGKIVIVLAGQSAKPNGNSASSSILSNPWDDVLPGGDHGEN
jgi:hypothetical protein